MVILWTVFDAEGTVGKLAITRAITNGNRSLMTFHSFCAVRLVQLSMTAGGTRIPA